MKIRNENAKCGNCPYWLEMSPFEGDMWGDCIKNAPSQYCDDKYIGKHHLFPETREGQRCG